MKEIRVTIDPATGDVVVATSGYRGSECFHDTKDLEAEMGTVTDVSRTPESKLKSHTPTSNRVTGKG
jgi:hypothetical protein